MTARQQTALEKALGDYADAHFEAGEWNRDDSDEPYERLHNRCVRAEARIRRLIGLPPKPQEAPPQT